MAARNAILDHRWHDRRWLDETCAALALLCPHVHTVRLSVACDVTDTGFLALSLMGPRLLRIEFSSENPSEDYMGITDEGFVPFVSRCKGLNAIELCPLCGQLQISNRSLSAIAIRCQ